MKLVIPSIEEHTLRTERLTLEPIVVEHAQEMLLVLNETELYKFLPSDPLTLEKLQRLYKIWEKRISKEEDEVWLNWAARENTLGELIGHFQSGVRLDGDSYIAYIVNSKYQRQGYAYESLIEIIDFLKTYMKLKNIKAWIDTRNKASIALVEKLGMKHVNFIKNADYFKNSSSNEYVYELKV
jgi:[ribosomal protein S5]-alanine N-acetyltransferase